MIDAKSHILKITNKLNSLVKKAIISKSSGDNSSYPVAQVTYFGKEANIETIYPYGISSNAPAGTMSVAINVGGQEESLIGFAYSTAERFKALSAGEVQVGSPATGSSIKFAVNRDIAISSNNNMKIDSKKDILLTCANDFALKCDNTYTVTSHNFNITSSSLGYFNAAPVPQQAGGVAVAGGVYTANEQQMLSKVYNALRAYGLIS